MARRYDVHMTLVSQRKKCPNGHKVGDQWLIGREPAEPRRLQTRQICYDSVSAL